MGYITVVAYSHLVTLNYSSYSSVLVLQLIYKIGFLKFIGSCDLPVKEEASYVSEEQTEYDL